MDRMTSVAPVSSTHRRCPAVCREVVFGDLRSAPQMCPEVVRSMFVTFGTSYLNIPMYRFNFSMFKTRVELSNVIMLTTESKR